MRKSRVILTRPKRNACRYRFPVTNELLWFRFSPLEFSVLVYLHYCRIHRENDVITAEDVADHIHVNLQTTKKTLTALIKGGLVSEELRLTRVAKDTQNFFTIPNEIFMLELSPTALMVYAYLLLLENRKTHTCHPSYEKIGRQIGKSRNTVRKYVTELEDKKLISANPTSIQDKYGRPRNGSLLYTILPIQIAANEFHERQLARGGTPHLTKKHRRVPSTAPLCDTPASRQSSDPPQKCGPASHKSELAKRRAEKGAG